MQVKCIDVSELDAHFLLEQLPLSLGGTYKPSISSPSHPEGVTRDDSAVHSPRRAPPYQRRGSDGGSRRGSNVGSRKEAEEVPHPSPGGGGKSVNKMLNIFEGGHSHQASNRPPPPSSPTRGARPIPPARPTAARKPPTQPSVQPLMKLSSSDMDFWNKSTKVPLLPPNGRPNLLSSGKLQSVDVPPPGSNQLGKTAKSAQSKEGIAKSSGTKDGEEGGVSESSKRHGVFSKTQGIFNKTHVFVALKKMRKTPAASTGESSSKDKHTTTTATSTTTDSLSTSFNAMNPKPEVLARRRADSADKAVPKGHQAHGESTPKTHHSPSSPPRTPRTPHGPNSPPRTPRTLHSGASSPTKTHAPIMHPLPYSAGKMTVLESKATPQQKSKSSYENVNPPESPIHRNKPHPQPHPLNNTDLSYENMAFCNRDSDVYENVPIGFAGPGTSSAPGASLPPLPLTRHPVQPARQSYENVEIGVKSPGKGRSAADKKRKDVVEEDDDTFFGQEGPPGMQELIYENFGPDQGNRFMTTEQLAAHAEKLGKKGLSTEYLRVRNEPITRPHKACR